MLALFLIFVFLPWQAIAAELSGQARVIDGDTLVIAGEHIRLQGIDAPEMHQTCYRMTGAVREEWPCGQIAAAFLRARLVGLPVTCTGTERDRYGRMLATCRIDGENINGMIVREGWAVAYSRYSHAYEPDEAYARQKKLGIWSSEFESPAEWRAERR